MKDEIWVEKKENGEKESVEDKKAEKNWMNDIEADEEENSSSENTDDSNLSDRKSEVKKADVMNHKKAFHDETLVHDPVLGSSRWTRMADSEDSLAPAYREVIRELEEHRQHFKVEFCQMQTKFQSRFLPNIH